MLLPKEVVHYPLNPRSLPRALSIHPSIDYAPPKSKVGPGRPKKIKAPKTAEQIAAEKAHNAFRMRAFRASKGRSNHYL